MDCGDNVIVINAAKVGADRPQARAESLLPAHRLYRRHQGTHRQSIFAGRFPERVLEKAVERMLPRGPLGRQQIAQSARLSAMPSIPMRRSNPEKIDVAAMNRKNKRSLMAETMSVAATNWSHAQALAGAAAAGAEPTCRRLDKQGRAYATGKRKDAVARVWVKPGTGKIIVNGRDGRDLFRPPGAAHVIQQPLVVAEPRRSIRRHLHRVRRRPFRPGRRGRHGISKALISYEPDLRGCSSAAAS